MADLSHLPVGNIVKPGLGVPEIVPVEAPLLEDLSRLESHPGSLGGPAGEPDQPGHVLAEIQHLLSLGGADEDGLAFSHHSDRRPRLGHDGVACLGEFHAAQPLRHDIGVEALSVVDTGGQKTRGPHLKLPVRLPKGPPILTQLSSQQISVPVDVRPPLQTEAPFIPAVPQGDLQLVVLPEQSRHIIGLIADIAGVLGETWGEQVLPHPVPVEVRLIEPQAGDVQPGIPLPGLESSYKGGVAHRPFRERRRRSRSQNMPLG